MKCKSCGVDFHQIRTMQAVCGPVCALKQAREYRGRQQQEKRLKRAEIKSRKEALKTIPQLIKEAQKVFNTYIRLRDSEQPCICCGRPLADSEGIRGAGYDAGHYRSTGSASHLRFHEDNVHAQRKDCNRYGAGRAVNYRVGLIARIGKDRVEKLEANNVPHKWTREQLGEIREKYKQKLKDFRP